MPDYQKIDVNTPQGQRTIERLIKLKQQFRAENVPPKTLDQTLLLATWNIRDFDKPAYGQRSDEAIIYIAEVISHFDIVAVQEVYRDMSGLERVMEVLGNHWRYFTSDATEGDQGNDERLVYVYDTRKIVHGGVAGEIVIPPMKDADGNVVPAPQVWRSPYYVGFETAWARFALTTVHILWGGNDANSPERVAEINRLAQFLKTRTEDPTAWARNQILLGDFNIFNPGNKTFEAITEAGFMVPEALQALPSNANKNRHYDQIAFRLQPDARLDFTGKAGVLDYYQSVYREEDESLYIREMGESYNINSRGELRDEAGRSRYYKTYWRTHQMSDHLPMWVELKINFAEEYLKSRLV